MKLSHPCHANVMPMSMYNEESGELQHYTLIVGTLPPLGDEFNLCHNHGRLKKGREQLI